MRENLQPNVPEWLENTQRNAYAVVMREELARCAASPDAYFGQTRWNDPDSKQPIDWEEYKQQRGLSAQDVAELARVAQESLLADFQIDEIGDRAAELLDALPEHPASLGEDLQDVVRTLGSRIHRAVLKRLVQEHIPRRQAILHRGSFRHVNPGLHIPEKATTNVLEKLGPLGTLLKIAVKDQTYRVEEIRENLEHGIGGFEFDIRMNKNGEPVVTHANTKQALEDAPPLSEMLDLVREMLPADPQAPRDARRGLKLFLHLKTSGDKDHPEFPAAVLKQLYERGLTQQVYFQTGRPEFVHSFDTAEQSVRQENDQRSWTHFAFQSAPLTGKLRGVGHVLKNIGLADHKDSEGNLTSMTGLADEQLAVTEFPPSGDLADILRKHKSLLGVPAVLYRKELLGRAKESGFGIHIGMFEKEEDAEMMLEADEAGNRPATMMTGKEGVVLPPKK
ncbi:MAG: hypothetical protein HY566_01250 [Candidatus Kerfeldbacteria bacterium]|nr:hypothetical protein [Candidatus Kerfeldbacteria bacterium]